MAASSTGPRNQPVFLETNAPEIGGDLTAVAAYAAKRGNHISDTAANRLIAPAKDATEGTMWTDTDTGRTWTRRGGAWIPLRELVGDDYLSISTAPLNAGATVVGNRTYAALPYPTVIYIQFLGSFFASPYAGGRRLVGNVAGGTFTATPTTDVHCAASVDTPYAWGGRVTVPAGVACVVNIAITGTANQTSVRGVYQMTQFMAA